MVDLAPQIAAYLRVSSDKQDVTRQKESITRWAKLNGPISLWFEDSVGRNPRDQAAKRAGFQRLLKAVESGLLKTIVVDSQDRFGVKDAHEWGKFATQLREHDCELIDSSGKVLTADDDVSILTSTLGALTSTREQKEKAHRNVSAKIGLAKKGEYQGGNPPYGFDVVCFDADGKEKWRTLYVGHYKRFKVYPDGTRESFDGKGNSPRKDPNDVMFLRPSIDKSRVKNVQRIFEWYSTESISPGQIASRLNKLGVGSVFADTWHKVHIRAILCNPVCIGFPTWNKRGGSRFAEFVGGQIVSVSRKNGKAKVGRCRAPADFVQADNPQFAPLIDSATWERTQQKIKIASEQQMSIPRRPAQTEELWLKSFLICGRCGKPMRASRGGSGNRTGPSYFCSTYGTYGKDNSTGCHCHRVRHDVIEAIVVKYVADTSPKIKHLLLATGDDDSDALTALTQEWVDSQQADVSLSIVLQDFFEDHLKPGQLLAYLKQGKKIPEIYGAIYDRMRPAVERQVATKEKELDKLLDGYVDLTGGLRDRARVKMEALQTEIEQLRLKLTDLRRPLEDSRKELEAREAALQRAKKALSTDIIGRKKAESLASVVDRVVLHFEHGKTVINNGKSNLTKVEIVPVSGDVVQCFTNG